MSESKKTAELNHAMQELEDHLRLQCVNLDDHRWHNVCIIEWLSKKDDFKPFLLEIHRKNAFPELIAFLTILGDRGFLNMFT